MSVYSFGLWYFDNLTSLGVTLGVTGNNRSDEIVWVYRFTVVSGLLVQLPNRHIGTISSEFIDTIKRISTT